jgi:Putative MetA-pathway of phenol degradation
MKRWHSCRIVLFLTLALAGFAAFKPVWSGPISFNSAIGLAENEFVLREQYILNQATDDPGGNNRGRRAQSLISVLAYAINSDLMLVGVLPYIDKELDVTVSGTRQSRSVNDVADLRLFSRYTLFRRNWSGGTLRISPFAGIEVPTGDDDEQDSFGKKPIAVQAGSGSWDPFAGLVLTYQTLDFEVDTSLSYQENTQANGIELGDIVRFDASFQYRLWPRKLQSGVPGFLYGVFESNVVYQGKNRFTSTSDPNSGGTRVFLVPGLQFVTRRWVIETAVQLPVTQDLNGSALENDYILRAGFRFNF